MQRHASSSCRHDSWQAWQRQLPSFKMIKVNSSCHMTLLTGLEIFDMIAEFCVSLYEQKWIEAKRSVRTVLT